MFAKEMAKTEQLTSEQYARKLGLLSTDNLSFAVVRLGTFNWHINGNDVPTQRVQILGVFKDYEQAMDYLLGRAEPLQEIVQQLGTWEFYMTDIEPVWSFA